MARSISLANKCQLLFGGAVILIVTAALIGPWIRMGHILDKSEFGALRDIAAAETEESAGLQVRLIDINDVDALAEDDEFARTTFEQFKADPNVQQREVAIWEGEERLYMYARALRDEEGALTGVILVQRRSTRAAGQLFVNRLFLLGAGIAAGTVAVLVFYFIVTRLILSPVRSLKETAERIMAGDLDARATIQTGDEYEQLSDAFNDMVIGLEEKRAQLHAANQSLDLKVARLEQANLSLHESAQLKGDFIAAVSHELRTPLNSIIGFAELLQGIATSDRSAGLAVDLDEWSKRKRYLDNIVDAGRTLLEMINELLDMAKIEAGKMDLHVELMNVTDACDGLLALIRPQAERRNITLVYDSASARSHESPDESTPILETDPRKFQQIVFNFLSNAVKFTPDGGEVTLRIERMVGGDGVPRFRVSVLDSGPGIAPEDQERIFDKFTQIETGHTRLHTGTGLGLAIASELSSMIQGEIQLVSERGSGSMFSLIVPMRMDPTHAAMMTLRQAGRSRVEDGAEPANSPQAETFTPDSTD